VVSPAHSSLARPSPTASFTGMRDLDTIDSELRLLAACAVRSASMVASHRVARSTNCSTSA
jgi:hypothetical protein